MSLIRNCFRVLNCLPSRFLKKSYYSLIPKANFRTTSDLNSETNDSSDMPWDNEITSTEKVKINFITKEGEKFEVDGFVGENVMKVSLRHDLGEGGCCEGQLCCTTCHVYVEEEEVYDKLPELSFKEEDLLDGAPFLKDNSRLSCQIHLTKELEGATFKLPFGTVNFAIDKPMKKHRH